MYGKDLYGNRDPLPVEEAAKHLQKAIIALEQLPQTYQEFYLHKLGISASCFSSNNNSKWMLNSKNLYNLLSIYHYNTL